jgi:succinylarginine dihydrolase
MSASAMWAANAATVSPASDTADGRTHLTIANLRTMVHRSHEWPATLEQLRLAFAHESFAVQGPVPPTLATRAPPIICGCALATTKPALKSSSTACRAALPCPPACRGLQGDRPPPPPRSQSHAVVAQSEEAIAAGAFHNDVVAVANERVLLRTNRPSPIASASCSISNHASRS